MNRPLIFTLAAFAGALILVGVFFVYVLLASRHAQYWQGEVAAFERTDISNPPQKGVMVFVGADYIRLWPSPEADMAPYAIISRGLGGAQISHLAYYADRLINVHEPRAVVISAGIADLSDVGSMRAEDVFARFLDFFDAVRSDGRKPRIYVLALPQPPLKKRYWPLIRALNHMLAEYAANAKDIYFVDVATPMLTRSGEPRAHFFRWDGFHLNDEGYRLWARVLRASLEESEQPPFPSSFVPASPSG